MLGHGPEELSIDASTIGKLLGCGDGLAEAGKVGEVLRGVRRRRRLEVVEHCGGGEQNCQEDKALIHEIGILIN